MRKDSLADDADDSADKNASADQKRMRAGDDLIEKTEIARLEFGGISDNTSAFDGVRQLAHISRPLMHAQSLEGRLAQGRFAATQFLADICCKVARQEFNIISAFAQRG